MTVIWSTQDWQNSKEKLQNMLGKLNNKTHSCCCPVQLIQLQSCILSEYLQLFKIYVLKIVLVSLKLWLQRKLVCKQALDWQLGSQSFLFALSKITTRNKVNFKTKIEAFVCWKKDKDEGFCWRQRRCLPLYSQWCSSQKPTRIWSSLKFVEIKSRAAFLGRAKANGKKKKNKGKTAAANNVAKLLLD